MAETIVYATGPIDYWDGWIDLSKQKAGNFVGEYTGEGEFQNEVDEFLANAKKVASEVLGWEGDMIQGPYLSALPDPSGVRSLPMIGWKQRNNGSTFIATQLPLRHLDEEGYSSAQMIAGSVVERG
jgi:hypothetical protein